jgi:hypothetical protein
VRRDELAGLDPQRDVLERVIRPSSNPLRTCSTTNLAPAGALSAATGYTNTALPFANVTVARKTARPTAESGAGEHGVLEAPLNRMLVTYLFRKNWTVHGAERVDDRDVTSGERFPSGRSTSPCRATSLVVCLRRVVPP